MPVRQEWLDLVLAEVRDEEVIQLEKDLVSIPSYTIEERQMAEFISDFLTDQRIEVNLQEVSFPRNTKSPNQSSFNVVGRIHGSGDGPSLMFNGHMDHGPIEGRNAEDFSRWQRNPWMPVVEGDYLYGKGCQDEKGGICAFLSAARAIARAGLKPRGDLIFAPVCGHKTHSTGVKALIAAGTRADMAINSENSGNCIVPLHVGVMTARVHVYAAPVHPFQRSKFPQMREQPTTIQRSVRVVEALGRDCVPHDPGTSWLTYVPHPLLKDFPEHRIDAIESYGYQHQAVYVMFRTVPGQSEESIRQDLERVLDRLRAEDPTFQARAETQLWGPPLETPSDARVVQTLARSHRQVTSHDANVGPGGRYGAYGDGAVLGAAGMSTCIYGPGGGLSDLEHERKVLNHEIPADERISVGDLVTCARAMTLTALELCC
ncbi:MAG: M20 family metallopeptidase [Armatimonadota bacterium]